MTVFYRVHWADCPDFTADNAWSALWGGTRSDDGSQTECRACDGDGLLDGTTCEDCDGEGWDDCAPGYSCTASPQELIEYFAAPGMEPGSGDLVVIFEGREVGTGPDGEPTAVPEHVVETLTWADFLARQRKEDA